MMKQRAGQAGWIFAEAVHQLGRIVMLLVTLGLTVLVLVAFRLSLGPIELPDLAARLAVALSGQGVTAQVGTAELAWDGFRSGGVPVNLHISGLVLRNAAGGLLASVPSARMVVPPADLFGGNDALSMEGAGATLLGVSAPVSWRADLWPGPDYTFAHGDVTVLLGAGRLSTGNWHEDISSGGFVLHAAPGVVTITDGALALAPHGQSAPRITFGLNAKRGTDWRGTLHVTADAVQAADLGTYWPAPALKGARQWVLTNITSGLARQASFSFALHAPPDLGDLTLDTATGRFTGQDLTLTWLPKVKPITQLDGVFVLRDLTTIVVTGSAGQVGGVTLTGGTFTITGLDKHVQYGNLDASMGGAVPDLVGVLNAPPLSLLRHAPPGIVAAKGSFTARVTAHIPFLLRVSVDDIGLGVSGTLHGLAFVSPLPPLAFTQGEISLAVTARGLTAKGRAQFAGEPARLAVAEDFAATGAQDVTLDSAAGPPVLHVLGLDAGSLLGGPAQGVAPFTLHVSGGAVGPATATVHADLTPLSWPLDELGWSKTAGDAGTLSLTAGLTDGNLTSLQALDAQAPGLALHLRGAASGVQVAQAVIGRTNLIGRIFTPASPGAPWQVSLNGAELDLRPSHGAGAAKPHPAAAPQPATPPSGPPWTATLAVQRLDLAGPPAPPLQNVSLTASGVGGTVLNAEGTADGLSVTVAPQTRLRRALILHAADAGLLLRALDAFDDLLGGQLDLTASYGGGQAMSGDARLTGFRLAKAPGIAKILQVLTVYGVGEATSGPGLEFDRADVPFTLQDGVFTMHGARAFSTSLGFTASGVLDTNASTCNIDATVVPAYALNILPSRIPFLGRLFSAEQGGGLIALRTHISGLLNNPDVMVNPLSALTPGFLRDIFGLGK
jgi:hypothetical protein